MFTDTTVGCAAAITLAWLCCGSYETAMASAQFGLPHMPHHMIKEFRPSSNGSHGQRHGQAPQLQATNEQPKIQSLSSANKFGQSANSIRGQIKNLTNTIEFIFQHEILVDT
jgi:hypothetical protein